MCAGLLNRQLFSLRCVHQRGGANRDYQGVLRARGWSLMCIYATGTTSAGPNDISRMRNRNIYCNTNDPYKWPQWASVFCFVFATVQ